MLDANIAAQLNQMGIDPGLVDSLLSGALLLTGLAVMTAIPTAVVAKRKGRSVALWVLLALSIPVLPLLLVWLLPQRAAAKVPAEREKITNR